MSTWRVGRTLGRTLYRDEVCVGMVDTPEIAALICTAMNAAHRATHPRWGVWDLRRDEWWPRNFTSREEAQVHYEFCRGPGSRCEVREIIPVLDSQADKEAEK